MSTLTAGARFDPDFARDVLAELYTYPRKRKGVAWLLWATLGWAGGHRFYLGRDGTGALMLFTVGGALVWWVVDAFLLGEMVRRRNAEQDRRREEGLPPLALAFMPALSDDALARQPPWLEQWHARSRGRRGVRVGGDLLVLMAAGAALGGLVGTEGGPEAMAAVSVLALLTTLGAGPARLRELPVLHDMIRWSHRLRLFYYYNRPGSPPALLVRPVLGILLAPFRKRARAEVALYLELGAAFTIGFLLLDAVPEILVPLSSTGLSALSPVRLAGLWLQEAFMSFLLIYAFAAPVGAVLTFHILTRATHTLARLLTVFTLIFIGLGAGVLG